jgi:hypothetical protein
MSSQGAVKLSSSDTTNSLLPKANWRGFHSPHVVSQEEKPIKPIKSMGAIDFQIERMPPPNDLLPIPIGSSVGFDSFAPILF